MVGKGSEQCGQTCACQRWRRQALGLHLALRNNRVRLAVPRNLQGNMEACLHRLGRTLLGGRRFGCVAPGGFPLSYLKSLLGSRGRSFAQGTVYGPLDSCLGL
jgi:hypothetical protein